MKLVAKLLADTFCASVFAAALVSTPAKAQTGGGSTDKMGKMHGKATSKAASHKGGKKDKKGGKKGKKKGNIAGWNRVPNGH